MKTESQRAQVGSDGKSTCPWCQRVNNHKTGDVCAHVVKVTVKGVVFYRRKAAREIVDNLLETGPEIPAGFIARRDAEAMEFRYDGSIKGYRITKHWPDDYTGKPRKLDGASHAHVSDPAAFIAQKIAAYEGAGWIVERL